MIYPKIYLAIDNCFAYKRWTDPREWCEIIASLGLKFAEASADTELDPLYMGPEYLADWEKAVIKAQRETGVKVVDLYSGHSTYTTLGLTHTDKRVRERLIEQWFKPMITMAGKFGAGFGFFAHAFPHRVLQDAVLYGEAVELLVRQLAELNEYAASANCRFMAIEQMYSPHQYPWTIRQTGELLKNVSLKSRAAFYFTEDVGHHRSTFQKPDTSKIGKQKDGLWFGSDRAFLYAERGDIAALNEEIEKQSHLFSGPKDSDCYAWLSELGCLCPIIHLQQTDGNASSHLPFTETHNARGIIDGPKLLRSLISAYDGHLEGSFVPCKEIYLTLEIFAGTAAITHDLLSDLRESISYWRRWIPEDGLYLDDLVGRLSR